ncbi:MAG: monovalent cation/H(+) antiporter subunit G [Alphaproteobacteria bacterium]|nr:monovalent cation/H(+) antiporter subunit G [Alphaproteobacteria bacterium]MBU1552280.1 monovalent cation/H(+) antiporter subunit G [Alphaproteobacteria bacterium]MBU2336812.1 monovalent cation/H(+) antiporter subunit G [Alphaproteobacteria bacterium]MBU2389568.1 monovalent cation/H(+) antiporter subunit G [Alphaproteobacteria bacterium]
MIYSASDIPVWAAVVIAFFLLGGAVLVLIGAIGFLRMSNFYERLHPPTLSTSWGTGGIMIASILFFSISGERLVAHEILIGIFVTVTTPVTFMLLARAALHRDRFEKSPEVPRKQNADTEGPGV